jgi:toxin secretion/phage lysis holin
MQLQDIQFTAGYWTVLLPLIFMLGDFVTGFLNAWIRNEVKSSMLRIGGVHKGSELLALMLVWFVQQALALPVNLSAIYALYLVFMEATSIIENLDKMGVPVPKWLKKRINNVIEEIDKEE